MRIISKFSDYYDIVMGEGLDLSLTFQRETHEMTRETGQLIMNKFKPFFEFAESISPYEKKLDAKHSPMKYSKLHLTYLVAIFAGRVYPCVCVQGLFPNGTNSQDGISFKPPIYVYNMDDLNEILDEHGAEMPKRKHSRYVITYMRRYNTNTKDFLGYSGSDKLLLPSIDLRVPCAVIRFEPEKSMTINPKMSEIQLYKRLDSYQAYQEMSMFLGNLASPEKNIIEIEDKYRIAQHGFDKHSFRKRSD